MIHTVSQQRVRWRGRAGEKPWTKVQGNSKVRERMKKESQFPSALNFHHIVIVLPGKRLYNDGDDWLLKEREDESLCRKSSTFSNG